MGEYELSGQRTGIEIALVSKVGPSMCESLPCVSSQFVSSQLAVGQSYQAQLVYTITMFTLF